PQPRSICSEMSRVFTYCKRAPVMGMCGSGVDIRRAESHTTKSAPSRRPEALVQLFHARADTSPGIVQHGMPLSGFAHAMGEIWIIQEAGDRGAESPRITLHDYAGPRLPYDLGRTDFRRYNHRYATPHGL